MSHNTSTSNGGTAARDELICSRVFEAPRELVFRCLVEPEHLARFWGPTGVSTPLHGITVDARPGGAFETVMVNEADGTEYPTRAVFLEVVEPEKLVWMDHDSGVVTTSTFTDLGDARCEMTIRQTEVPAAYRTPEARAGFQTSLDRFRDHLVALQSRPRSH